MSDDIEINLDDPEDINIAVDDDDPISVEMPEGGMDGRSIHPAGEWSDAVEYAYLDLVSYEGSSYTAVRAVPAGTALTDTYYWQLTAEKGDPGDPGAPEWGDITGDLSDQTDLQEALDAKADVILSSVSGSIASFSDGSASPVTALSVAINPVQDLHGYDNPWPAGGGKNLWNIQAYEGLGYNAAVDTVVSLTESTATVSGNNISYAISAWGGRTFRTKVLTAGTYHFHVDVSAVTSIRMTIYQVDSTDNTVKAKTNYTSGTVIDSNQVVEDGYYLIVYIGSNTAQTISVTNYQIESGNAFTAWSPWENICPISGHTSATVTRTGKNLYDASTLLSGAYNNAQFNIPSTSTVYRSIKIFLKSGTYTLSSSVNIDIIRTLIDGGFDSTTYGNRTSHTFTTNTDGYVGFSIRRYDRNDWDDTTTLQLELGSSATAYEAPNIQTVTIDLDGTRYGGNIDVLAGTMKVTHKFIAFNGTEEWTAYSQPYYYQTVVGDNKFSADGVIHAISSHYESRGYYTDNWVNQGVFSVDASRIRFRDTNIATLDAWAAFLVAQNTAGTPVQVCYELAAPLTVTLTPSQMSTLLWQNNIWADTGDTSVEYRADTKLYIDGVASATAKVTRQMIADSATADGKAPKSLATGDLIIVGDELRKATANIGNGSAITASNSTTATLADVIKALQ